MKKVSIILFSIIFAIWQIGCSSSPDNTVSNNTNTQAANNETNVNTTQSNAVAATNDESVPTYTDANTAFAEGNKFYDSNDTEKAIAAYKQAVKLDPDLAEAHFKLGVIYSLNEMEEDSELEVATTPTPAKTAKKETEKVKKKDSEKAFEEAVKAYKKIVAKDAKNDIAYFNLGRSYNKLNDDKEAEKALRQAVKLKPEDSEYQTELGAILIKFAKYDEALGVLKKALNLDESNSQAQDLIEKAEAGKRRVDYGIPKGDKSKSAKSDKAKEPQEDKAEEQKEQPKKEKVKEN